MYWFRKKQSIDKQRNELSSKYENIQINLENLTNDKIAYVLEESRLYLQNIFDSTALLSQKATFLLTLVAGIVGYVFIEFVKNYKQFRINDIYVMPLIGYFVILVWCFITLRKYLLPSLDYEALGNEPCNFMKNDEWLKFDYKTLMKSELLGVYQVKIILNYEKNKAMAKSIKNCVTILVAYPILIIMILFIAFLYFYLNFHLGVILDALHHLWNYIFVEEMF